MTVETIDQLKVIPKETLNFKLFDFIILQLIFQYNLSEIVSITDNTQLSMGQLSETARYLPLSITGVLYMIYRKIFLERVVDESITLLNLVNKQGEIHSCFDYPIKK